MKGTYRTYNSYVNTSKRGGYNMFKEQNNIVEDKDKEIAKLKKRTKVSSNIIRSKDKEKIIL